MKNIETPLTWGLGVLAIILIFLSSLNTTSVNFNMSDIKSNENKGFNLNHDHQAQETTVFNISVWGEKPYFDSLSDEVASDSTFINEDEIGSEENSDE